MLQTITDPEEMRKRSRAARGAGRSIGFVPTMGGLHDGHASLLRRARSTCGLAVASIFVNPTQFGPDDDFERYPRDLQADTAVLERLELDLLFRPDAERMYPGGQAAFRTCITVEDMSDVLCGASRPGHFRGVTTVVAKLLAIVEPDVAFFGQKDAQQAIIIRTMVRDLNLPTRIDVCPTVREPDGLAMSSRNDYLSPTERKAAPVIYRSLRAAEETFDAGERSPAAILARALAVLDEEPALDVEYLKLVDTADLKPIETKRLAGEALLAVAGRIGDTRLIDNIVLAVKA